MQVESPYDVVCAYASQVVYLERRLDRLKKAETPQTDPAYIRATTELTGCQNALTKIKGILAAPKGQWVLVLRSKAPGLQGCVGKVTYVNEKHNFCTVSFDGDTHSHNLGMGKLEVVSLPVPTMRVPCAGMRVKFKGDPTEYLSIKWESTSVYVEPVDATGAPVDDYSRQVKRAWQDRFEVESINDVPIT